jgi:2-oxoglutarate ferredoxin oxidoreductase subunit alpha
MIFSDTINIVIAGEAGQGIETATDIITKLLHANKFNVFSTLEYMSRIRGGSNSALIKVSKDKSPCFSNRIDILFAMDKKVFEHLKTRITSNTISLNIEKNNFYIVGYISSIFKLNEEKTSNFLKEHFMQYSNEKNLSDFQKGFSESKKNSNIKITFSASRDIKDEMIISGNDSLGIGCIAGGCNFLPFYPMSPATFLQEFLINYSDEFKIMSKQVEDEISVINMALGGWFAGARALVSTSGGGFSLMCEALSLAEMIESPIVINIAQRPGPATGLPTRTEQGDLNSAIYCANSSFPRIIYAPANIEDAFSIAQMSFNIADKFQIPVFILTDQFFLDSVYSCKRFEDLKDINSYIVKSSSDYKRYKFSQDSISPRAIPDYGDGIVCVDSDEHDETGYITEDFYMRVKMVEKRLSKFNLIKKEILEPYLINCDNYKTLIISWGSNFHVIKEAIKDKKDFALLHFIQLYPINKRIIEYICKAKRIILIEQNATGEFGRLLKSEFGIEFDKKFLKYSGLPFSVEEIKKNLGELDEI